MPVRKFIGALDQGTTRTRFMIFDAHGAVIACERHELTQHLPRPGWVD